MFSNILMYVCLAGIAVSIPVCIALWLNQLDVHPLARLLASFRRLPWPGRIVVVLFAAQMILFGSVKNPTNNLLGIVRPFQDQSFVSGFTEDEISVGYVLWRIGTNESWAAESPASHGRLNRPPVRLKCPNGESAARQTTGSASRGRTSRLRRKAIAPS